MPLLIERLLTHFLINRQYQIKHKEKLSNFFSTSAGMPQGSVLSPTVFNMFTNDTPPPLDDTTLFLQYADDVTILIQAKHYQHLNKKITQELTHLDKYQAEWIIKTNKTKSNSTL